MPINFNSNKFKAIGGDVVLDFVNTVSGWLSNPAKKNARDYRDVAYLEKLNAYEDLVDWSFFVKLLDAGEAEHLLQLAQREPQKAQNVFARALLLRATLYRLFKASIEGWNPEFADVEILNCELFIARKHEKLSFKQNGFEWEWKDRTEALDSMLWQLAAAAAELLVSTNAPRIRQCGGKQCGWLFLDASRNHSRQWCDMKDCGNLAKVRRFRERQV